MSRRASDREVAAFVLRAVEDATRAWKPGDACRPYRGTEPTTVERVDAEAGIVYLANGESMHFSHMRRID